MRFIGWILLLVGFLLCVSIAWAALGFLLMGVGLITLQVGEQKRRRMKLALAAAEALDVSVDGAPPPRKPRRANWDRPPYDKARWQELVDSDPDLAQLASVLADYGPQYVDELATSYMAAPDKSRLGGIVDTIIARARGEALRSPPSSPPPPSFDPPPVITQRERAPDIAVPPPLKAERPVRLPPPVPPEAPPTDLEASLLAAVAEASAQANAARAEPPLTPPPSRLPFGRRERSDASEPRPERAPPPVPPNAPLSAPGDLEASLAAALVEGTKQPGRREPDFRAPARSNPAKAPPPAFTPPPLPDREPNELEASLIAAVTAASAKANAERAETPQAVPPVVAKRPTEAPKLAREVKLTPPPPPPPAPPAPPPAAAAPPPPSAPLPPPAAPINDLDESLLAALAGISGQPTTNRADAPKPPATPAAPPPAPKQAAASSPGADDDLSEMIKRFAPDSNFLSKK